MNFTMKIKGPIAVRIQEMSKVDAMKFLRNNSIFTPGLYLAHKIVTAIHGEFINPATESIILTIKDDTVSIKEIFPL